MKKTIFTLSVLFLCLVAMAQQGRKTIDMDKEWRFELGTKTDAAHPSFDDSAWRVLDVPHDWSREGAYDSSNKTGRGGGYLPSGDGWYRKSFSLPESDKGKQVFIEFDGVMANSEVYINGQLLGIRPYGYTSFVYDMTAQLKFGEKEKNTLAVRANNIDQPASRWYTGAGIYRHVRLVVKDPVHLAHWGVFVTTPSVSEAKASVKAAIQVDNTSAKQRSLTIQSAVVDKSGKTVKTASSTLKIAANSSQTVEQNMEVLKPLLWDLENTNMYQLITKVIEGKTVLDEQLTNFGIRSIRYDATTGFFLNEKPLKMYGACMHHDGGAVGSAVPLGVWEYRLGLLRQAGINAIRTSHNPMAPEFYDLCDRMGFLVMDENFDTWEARKNPYDYHLYFKEWWEKDLTAQVMRDRNHPSIVLYSVGNEIHDKLDNPEGFKKYKDQQDLIHQLDPTRPVTMALFRPNTSGVYNNGFADMMDVVGQNYRPGELLAAHAQNPKRITIGTENVHDLETYLALRDNEFMCGQFLWAGFDYLGESAWPRIAYGQALFDKVGGWKQLGLLRSAWWGKAPVVHVVRKSDNAGEGEWVHDWTAIDPVTYDEAYLAIYTNAEEVELFLNNESVGIYKRPANHAPIPVNINYKKGELRAEARTGGKLVAKEVHTTAGAPHHIVLTPHKTLIANNRNDVSYVKATLVDKDGIPCPNNDQLIKFTLKGAGKIIATDNGDGAAHEQYILNEHSAYMGDCYAIVMANQDKGKIQITASAEGIEGEASAEITVE
ncbi:glycoside hydrolase family 2 TIM barrel-domain containing protein [Viscerimonas tarda]